MQKKFMMAYLLIFVTLLIMMSVSRHTSETMRGGSVAFLAPFWEKLLALKHFISHPTQPSPFSTFSPEEETQHLQLENQLLSTEISYLTQLLNEQVLFSTQLTPLDAASIEKSDYQQSIEKMLKQLKWRLKGIPARVIFRSFDTWNSSLWINVGRASNQNALFPIVSKNSPVVVGRAIVGIIDYVGEHQSRVRLITDHRLTPSVRAARGGEQDLLISEYSEGLLLLLNRKKNFPLPINDRQHLLELLQKLKQNLNPYKKSWYLAKGELLGSPSASRRGQEIYLKGTGFNYDFADEEGTGRDLRTGKPLQQTQEPSISILKLQDILVTTGMDGIFPPGFQIATVSKIDLLKEGDYFYHLEAKPIADPLEELSLVFVLPPVREESEEDRCFLENK